MPYGPVPMSPAISALHYGQSFFEGMKAYLNPDKELLFFRPLDNFHRLNLASACACLRGLPEILYGRPLSTLLRLRP